MLLLPSLFAGTVKVDIETQIKGADSPIKFFDLGVLIASLAQVALLVGAVALFAWLIIAGATWVTAGGDKGKIESAQRMITQGIIGLAILACSFAVFAIIQYVLGIDIVKQ